MCLSNLKEERPKKEDIKDPDAIIFAKDKVKEKVDEGGEEVLSALSEEENNE